MEPVDQKKGRATSEQSYSSNNVRSSCFTIMPFGGYFDEYYESVYVPAIEAANLDAVRADDLYTPSVITTDIWVHTKKAAVVLADLTGRNPNVFYELGLAHALAKPAVLVTQTMADVPFDLQSLRVLKYDLNRPNWGDLLANDITKALNEIRDTPQEYVLPSFLKIDSNIATPSVTRTEKELLEIRQQLNLLSKRIKTSDTPFQTVEVPMRLPLGASKMTNKTSQYASEYWQTIGRERINVTDSRIFERLFRGMDRQNIAKELGVNLSRVYRVYQQYRELIDSKQDEQS